MHGCCFQVFAHKCVFSRERKRTEYSMDILKLQSEWINTFFNHRNEVQLMKQKWRKQNFTFVLRKKEIRFHNIVCSFVVRQFILYKVAVPYKMRISPWKQWKINNLFALDSIFVKYSLRLVLNTDRICWSRLQLIVSHTFLLVFLLIKPLEKEQWKTWTKWK